jgi:hypothetical protein
VHDVCTGVTSTALGDIRLDPCTDGGFVSTVTLDLLSVGLGAVLFIVLVFLMGQAFDWQL